MNRITLLFLLIGYLFCVNVLDFALFGIDKKRSRQSTKHFHRSRIEEATLIWLAIFGGSVGAILGMYVFHHKTRHKKFTILLPLILLAQVALAWYVYYQSTLIMPWE
ncbi:MAG: DUF1294 domain-containing protein [Paludibacteraceae bacterium]|nr:DUF1294 domain-containing protein [Paludibacteraceae bacterium]